MHCCIYCIQCFICPLSSLQSSLKHSCFTHLRLPQIPSEDNMKTAFIVLIQPILENSFSKLISTHMKFFIMRVKLAVNITLNSHFSRPKQQSRKVKDAEKSIREMSFPWKKSRHLSLLCLLFSFSYHSVVPSTADPRHTGCTVSVQTPAEELGPAGSGAEKGVV